jgi:hypothetical protein
VLTLFWTHPTQVDKSIELRWWTCGDKVIEYDPDTNPGLMTVEVGQWRSWRHQIMSPPFSPRWRLEYYCVLPLTRHVTFCSTKRHCNRNSSSNTYLQISLATRPNIYKTVFKSQHSVMAIGLVTGERFIHRCPWNICVQVILSIPYMPITSSNNSFVIP